MTYYVCCPDLHAAFGQKFSKGLDEVHPFSDSPSVDILLRDARRMISDSLETVGPKNASRIWGLISKFAMLDRFGKTLGVAKLYPGLGLARKSYSSHYYGIPGLKVNFFAPKPVDVA